MSVRVCAALLCAAAGVAVDAVQLAPGFRMARRRGQGALLAKKAAREGDVVLTVKIAEVASADAALAALLLDEDTPPNKHHVATVLTNVFAEEFEGAFRKYVEKFTRYTTPGELSETDCVSDFALAWYLARQHGAWGEYDLAFHDALQPFSQHEAAALLPGFTDLRAHQEQQVRNWTAAAAALDAAKLAFPAPTPSEKDFVWAANLLRTRSLASPWGTMVAPFAATVRPMHAACGAEAGLSAVEGRDDLLAVVLLTDVMKGGEVCVRYNGQAGELSDQQLLLQFGIIPSPLPQKQSVGLHYFIVEDDVDDVLLTQNCLPGERFLDPDTHDLDANAMKCILLHQLPQSVRGEHKVLLAGKLPKEEAWAFLGNSIERVLQQVYNVSVPVEPAALPEAEAAASAGAVEQVRKHYRFVVTPAKPAPAREPSREEIEATMPDELKALVAAEKERTARLREQGLDPWGVPIKEEAKEDTPEEAVPKTMEETPAEAAGGSTLPKDSHVLEMNARLLSAVPVLQGFRDKLLDRWHASKAREAALEAAATQREYHRVREMTQAQLEELELQRLMAGSDDEDEEGLDGNDAGDDIYLSR
eukprot:TRINITY_DN22545_c0_g1_i1.p1 TRINITY_DN22545_c0_g1~~TRINITY_DN22545_c0_g1_i1.p1  ORF type:complete len:606 (+),score=255.35 TRINITY_DN22545_c0_g1_i1:52-1818(+)